jgi:hypothetical protein
MGAIEANMETLTAKMGEVQKEMFALNTKVDGLIVEQAKRKGVIFGAASALGLAGGTAGAKLAKIVGLLSCLALVMTAIQGCREAPVPMEAPAFVARPSRRVATAIELVDAANTGVVPDWFSPAERAAVERVRR